MNKTTKEYQIHGNYGDGFEEVYSATTRADAMARLKEYRENERGIPFTLKIRYVRKGMQA
jgi:hypothetical protein